jgi:hypothetical protein
MSETNFHDRTLFVSLTIGIMEQWKDGILGTFVFHLVEKNNMV